MVNHLHKLVQHALNVSLRMELSLQSISFSLSPFSRWTWVSRCLSKQRMMEVVVTTGLLEL